MKIIRIDEGVKEFMFVCTSRDTRSGFAHDCTLFINNVEKSEATCYYINRTWEVYQYQTVCLCALNNVISDYIHLMKERYMQANNYKRMTAARAEDFEKTISDNIYLNTLKTVKDQLHNKVF